MARTSSASAKNNPKRPNQLSLVHDGFSQELSDENADRQGMLLAKARQYVSVSNNLNLTQRKLVNVLLHHAYPTLLTQEEHCIPIEVIENHLDIGANNRAFLKDSFRKLISTILEWAIIDDASGREDWEAAAALAQARVKGNFLFYSYAPLVRQKLYNPSRLSVLNLLISNRLKSIYSLALYEHCLLYRGQTHTEWIEIPIIQKLIGRKSRAGKSGKQVEAKPQEFKIFNRDVLQVAVAEINTMSNIIVTPEFMKSGNKVTHLRFILEEKELEARAEISTELLDYIVEFGFTVTQAKSMAEQYSEQHIRDALAVVEKQVRNKKLPTSGVTAFAAKSIKEGWADRINKFEIEEKRNIEYQREIEEAEAFNQQMRREFTEFRNLRVQQIINGITDDEKQDLHDEFMQTLNTFEQALFRKNGLNSILVQNKFKVFLCEKYLTKPEEVNYDEFVKTRRAH